VSTSNNDSSVFSVQAKENNPEGIAFNTDGTKMFITGPSDSVHEYHLSAGFDTSTASFDSSFSLGKSNPSSLAFNTDGTKMYLTNFEDVVHEFLLSTGFDVSTASFDRSFSVLSETENPSGLTFSTDGLKMFTIGPNDNVVEYTLHQAFNLISPLSYADLVLTFGLHTGFISDGSTPFFRPPATYDFVFQTNDADTDNNDNFYETSTTDVGVWDGSSWNASGGPNITLSTITLPFILSNISVASGTSRFFSIEWHLASGTNQILQGPTVRLLIRKTS